VRPPEKDNTGFDIQVLLTELQNNPALAATLSKLLTEQAG